MKKLSGHTRQLISLLTHCRHSFFSPSMFVRTSVDNFYLYLQEEARSGERYRIDKEELNFLLWEHTPNLYKNGIIDMDIIF